MMIVTMTVIVVVMSMAVVMASFESSLTCYCVLFDSLSIASMPGEFTECT